MTVSRLSVSSLAALGLAVLAGCGGGSGGETVSSTTTGGLPPQRRPSTVLISTDGHALQPVYTGLGFPGTYNVVLANNDKIPHALVVEGQGVKVEIGPVAPGKSASKNIDLSEPGQYKIYCPIDDHRSKGEEGLIARGT